MKTSKMISDERSGYWRYGIATICVLIAVFIYLLLEPLFRGEVPLLSFILAITISSLYGGIGAGIFATMLSTFLSSYLFLKPVFSIKVADPVDQTRVVLFLITGILISVICESLHRSRKRALRDARLARESQHRFRALTENNLAGVILLDARGLLTYANDAFLKIIGYDRAELESGRLRWSDFASPEWKRIAEQADLHKSEIDSVHSVVEEFTTKNGQRLSVLIASAWAGTENEEHLVCTIIDITDRVHAEEELRKSEERLLQSQKLESVGMLAGGIAHDFNNMLTAINGYSELGISKLPAEHVLRNYFEEINKAGERAARLTRQLLAFSRKQILEPKIIDLNEITSDLENMLRRLIGEDINLRTYLFKDLAMVKADPGQIEQVIMNLAVNSRDAMPDGGKLTIETRNVELDEVYAQQHEEAAPGFYVMLAVSDTGIGMDVDTKKRIFDPFFTTKGVGKGTGLGLSTVYGIVKQSGGHIWVYSEPGVGTTFKIYLPVVEEGDAEFVPAEGVLTNLYGTETILLAEDEDIVRKLAADVLQQYGYQVLEAVNGTEGLAICERHEGMIHLLLTDAVMPEMSGREMATQIANLRPEIKILYMSGYTENSIVHHGMLDAGTNFIPKPFTPDQMVKKVRKLLDAP